MPRAYLKIPHPRSSRWNSFKQGLIAAGFDVREAEFAATPDDAVVIWNRMRRDQPLADRFQKIGAKVIIAENGYIGNFIALARTYHNGAGQWPQGDGTDRWASMNISLMPWRGRGETILLLPQRGFGSPGVAMPSEWLNKTLIKVRTMTKRPVAFRRHPGQRGNPNPDFSNVWACVTWGSGAGIKALAAGIPVFNCFEHWIGKDAATPFAGADFEKPFVGDRLPMFQRLAYAQWSIAEIETGEPFRELVAL